jgi:hypothetical protein
MGLFDAFTDNPLGSIANIGMGFMTGGPVGAGIAAAGTLAQGQMAGADADAQQQIMDQNNAYAQEVYAAQMAKYEKEMELAAAHEKAMADAMAAGLEWQQNAFGQLQMGGEAEEEAMENLRKGLQEFGKKKKEAYLASSKAKRRKAMSGAIRGSKHAGTAGRPGRMSDAFRTGAAEATRMGTQEAADVGTQMAALSAYGEDLAREQAEFGDLNAFAVQKKREIDDFNKLAQTAKQSGAMSQSALSNQANAEYSMGMKEAQALGHVPPQEGQLIQPDYGIWGGINDLAGVGMMGYGMGTKGGTVPWDWQNVKDTFGNRYDTIMNQSPYKY